MPVTKSYIESVELESGLEAVVQASHSGNIVISFDGREANYSTRLTREEAIKLAELIKEAVEI